MTLVFVSGTEPAENVSVPRRKQRKRDRPCHLHTSCHIIVVVSMNVTPHLSLHHLLHLRHPGGRGDQLGLHHPMSLLTVVVVVVIVVDNFSAYLYPGSAVATTQLSE